MEKAHPCYGCTAQATDHAIVCPALGVIASGRHKAIQLKPEAKAFDALYGLMRTSTNKRSAIELRSEYWPSVFTKYEPVSASADGTLVLRERKSKGEGSPHAGKATSGRGGHGHLEGKALSEERGKEAHRA